MSESSKRAGAPDQDEFAAFWFDELRFCKAGKPEDAAMYLTGVLRAIAAPEGPLNYIQSIGGNDGLQEFVFQWLLSIGLTKAEDSPRRAVLSEKGQRLLNLLESESFYSVFGLDD